ncbi:MAG TPA: FlgD immunoglobulin-like domain containing protein [Candidatus Acidoferrales bacterium]|nr:FlgD immunoglobulin-like domain containing protein [Candidatus Acidoferrales bacterium]
MIGIKTVLLLMSITLCLTQSASSKTVPRRVSSTTPKAGIQIVGVSPYQLVQLYGSAGSSMYPTSGFSTVGEKTTVFLRAMDSTGGTIQSVSWSVVDPNGGHALIDSASAPFTTITPDTTGEYTINLQLTTAGGSSQSSATITSANYVGVGSVGIFTNDTMATDNHYAKFPQCAYCHEFLTPATDPTAGVQKWALTVHANTFRNRINGTMGYFAGLCEKCHTTGYNPQAENGNFANVASQAGWTFPTSLVDTNFAHLYNSSSQLAQLASVGCESCHGPGDQHAGDPSKISVSLSASVCMRCHDSPPYYNIGRMWVSSPHDSGMSAIQAEEATVNSGSATCAKCHNGSGFFDFASNNDLQSSYDPMPLTCAGCHNPHDASNPYQLRKVTADSLKNGFGITEGGAGVLCMNCHRSRASANIAVSSGWVAFFGPHEGPQTDIFFGENGYQFGDSSITGLNTHTQLTDACVTCHMASDTLDPKATNLLGGHTWKMSGPDSVGNQVDNTTACQSCHGPITDFDQIPAPYDYAGIADGGPIPGVQTEVQALLNKLASLLPDSVISNPNSATVGKGLTRRQLGALYDYLLVSKDGSLGIHNAKYTFALLTGAIGTLTGVKQINEQVPHSYVLEQNYPNPFNPTTMIDFSVPRAGMVNISIYNSVGQLVKVLTNDNYSPGKYQVLWDGTNGGGNPVASGVYFYRLVTRDGNMQVKKMILLK